MKRWMPFLLLSLFFFSCHNDVVYDYYPIYNGTQWVYKGFYSDSDSIFEVWDVLNSDEEGIGNVYTVRFIKFVGHSFYDPSVDTLCNDTFIIYKDRDKVQWIYGDSIFTILDFPLYGGKWWVGYSVDTCFVEGDTSVIIGEYQFDNVIIISTSLNRRYYFSNDANLIIFKNNGINMYLKSVVWGQ